MLRHLVLVLGDQLDAASAAFDGFDLARDAILQTQVSEEAIYIRQHKRRLDFFFAAMRHSATSSAPPAVRSSTAS
jgi:deoxyribodipyrimidine photolyase-related protein